MKMSELKRGQRARITSLEKLPLALRHKLMVMGLLPNSEICYLRAAPLGDPLQIQCLGINLALQKSVAELIEVELQ